MRFRLVTVAILLVAVSGGHGRPRVPDPLDGNSSSQEALAVNHGGGGPDSRYMMRSTRQVASTSPTYRRRRNISITSVKYGSGSLRSNWQGRSILPGLSFDGGRKNYLPLGALSSVSSRGNAGLKFTGRSAQRRSHLAVPFIPSVQISTPRPIPISVQRKSELLPRTSTPIPIPVLSPFNMNMMTVNTMPREQRKIETSRNIVRILPQKVKSGLVRYKNSTFIKAKPQVVDLEVKNWPNEALQNVEDLFNYEKYTSFLDNNIRDRNTQVLQEASKPTRREPSIKSPEVQEPVRWSKIPIVEPTSLRPITVLPELSDNDYGVIDTSMQIDNLLGDLETHQLNPQHQASSQVAQNTVVHILNTSSRKPNVTVVKPVVKVNRNKTGSTRPPQNVHIMFMMDKDEGSGNQTTQLPPQGLGNESDCPTILINSITQINNTIESKEGCTDLNIVINSHVLNTNVFKPTAGTQVAPSGTPESVKDPYGRPPVNYYQDIPTNNYGDGKDPVGELLSDDSGAAELPPEISTFEVFQGTHINVGGDTTGQVSEDDVPVESETTSGEGNDVNGAPLNEATEAANDIDGTNPQADPIDDAVLNPSTNVGQSSAAIGGPADVTGQANDAPGSLSLPSIPNIPNLSSVPNTLNNLANLGSGNSGGSGLGGGGQTGLAPAAALDDDDDDDLLEALSPDALLEGVSSVFTYFNVLNPINYGIFGMAVAPFVAFAAGILGVAAFIFPYAFPGAFDVARSWKGDSSSTRFKIDSKLRDMVHGSIHKYRHINEWKGRRRKRKRKR